jgi:hypothetical protein
MSYASPQNRKEFKEYVLTKLGQPVIQVNVSDEQLDLAINDAMQFFNERNHFNGVERAYLKVKIEDQFREFFRTSEIIPVEQKGSSKLVGVGFVDKLQLVNPGSGYPVSTARNKGAETNESTTLIVNGPDDIGSGLTVVWDEPRTVDGGILSVKINKSGSNYKVGDRVILDGGNNDCVFEVTEVKFISDRYGVDFWEKQRNYIIMPGDVLGVTSMMMGRGFSDGIIGGLPGVAMFNPFLMGGFSGVGQCGNMGFDLVDFQAMNEYLSTMQFMLFPPIQFNFNQRTHRLYLETDNFNGIRDGQYMIFECSVKPNPDLFPDIWNDMFLKGYCVALVKKQWGQNLTKFTQVQMPGGITMNGEMIYNEGKSELEQLESRFSMDWADPVLDLVG